MKLNVSALSSGLQEKYGVSQNRFTSLEQAVKDVERTPVLIDYIPKEYLQEKELILAFIRGNHKYMQAYYTALTKAGRTTSVTVTRSKNAEYLRNGKIRGIDARLIVPWLMDKDVLIALGQSHMWQNVTFTDENYNEKAVASAIKQGYKLVVPVLEYWMQRIPRDEKTEINIRTRFNLKMSDSLSTVAFFKCLDVINTSKGDKRLAIAELFVQGNQFYDEGILEEYQATMSAIMQQFDVQTQNEIVDLQYQLVMFMKPSDVSKELAKKIADSCVIAGNILPDEYVLKYKLWTEDCDVMQKCNECVKCALKRIRVV